MVEREEMGLIHFEEVEETGNRGVHGEYII